ncbi:extracellular solute-binding protein [Psychromicrobium xiongbiense]|uniref:extracellular solute-binding protein n=1 Tax=Psychromicrobium xiongbiense TaxID=3051184 RepID=UPI002555A075|nr:extracellular solute-binding protein [Psychromicrobium sp. YIM S02556]
MKLTFNSQEKVDLVQNFLDGRVSRRGFLKSASLLGITAVTASTVLTACDNGTGGAASSGSSYKAGSAQLKVELGAEDTTVLYPEGYVGPKARKLTPFGDGKTQFSVLTRTFAGQDMPTNKFSVWLEGATGVKVNYQVVPIGSEGTPKVNNILAGGDLPDALMLGPKWMEGLSRSQVYVYGKQGLFQPLGQLIDENAPELLEVFKSVPGLREEFTAPNGEIYAFPGVNQCYHCRSSDVRTWVNKKWLDKVGLSVPQTLDQFTAMLKAFKDQNPSGQPFAVPMSGSQTAGSSFIQYLMQSFGYLPSSKVIKDGNTLRYAPAQDFYREGLKYMAGLTKDGLIDPRTFSQSGDELIRQVMNPAGALIGVVQGGSQGYFAEVQASNPSARYLDYVPIPPLKNGSKNPVCPWDYTTGGVVGLVISKACKDPATMVRWADAQLNLQVTRSMPAGPLGVGFDWARKGDVAINGKQATFSRIAAASDAKNYGWYEWGPINFQNDVRLSESVNKAAGSIEPDLYQAGKLYEPFAVSKDQYFQAPFYDQDQAAKVGEFETNFKSYLDQANAQFILGKQDISQDSVWAAHQKKLKDLGVDQYLQILQQASGMK